MCFFFLLKLEVKLYLIERSPIYPPKLVSKLRSQSTFWGKVLIHAFVVMLELESLDQTNSSPVNFMAMDLKSQRDIDCLFSRTTAVTVIKQGHDLIIGNLGDSRAIFSTRN